MQTHAANQANQAKQQPTKAVQQPTQLVGEQQGEFADYQPNMGKSLQLRQLMDNSRQAAGARALQAMMNNSAQAHKGQALQAMLNNSTQAHETLAFQRMSNSRAQGRVKPTVQLATQINYIGQQAFSYDNPAVGLPGAGTPNNAVVGNHIQASLDLNNPVAGSGVGGVNPERTDTAAKHPATGWVMGHLLNSELGGIGKPTNLVPITNEANMEHAFAVERQVKKQLYRQPPTNISLNNNGFVEYEVQVQPIAPLSSVNPDLNLQTQWRTQIPDPINPAPGAPFGWTGWQQNTVESRAGGALPTPAAWNAVGNGYRAIGGPVTEWVAAMAAPALMPAGAWLPGLFPAGVNNLVIENAGTPTARIIGYQF